MEWLRNQRTLLLDLLHNPEHSIWLSPMLLLVDAALTGFIIKAVPCSSSQIGRQQQPTK